VPKAKQDYVFWFVGATGLKQLNNGLGREKRIYFSPIDYSVSEERQKRGDASEQLLGVFM